MAYDIKEAIVPPVPGKIPKKEPTPAPRKILDRELLNSPLSKRKERHPIFLELTTCPSPSRLALEITSAIPNKPIATATSASPSWSSGILKVNREMPVLISVPTTPKIKPIITIATPLMGEPVVKVEAANKPRNMSEKYSAGPNWNATSTNKGPKAIIKIMPMVAPIKEDSIAINKAEPARP